MKKNPKLLLGIVLIFTILIAGGHQPASVPPPPNYPDVVFIHLKAEQNGSDIRLLISDTREGQGEDAEGHYASVGPNTKVVWMRASDSNIRKIKVVAPTVENGAIFPGPAKTILLGKRRRIRVKENAPIGSQEKYEITVKTKFNNEPKTVDPYLRIEGNQGPGGPPD